MAVESKRDVDNLKKLIKNLKNIKTTIALVGERYKLEAFRRWDRGQNVGGQAFKRLSPQYKKFKTGKGKKGIPDLEGPSISTDKTQHRGGLLRKSLRSEIIDKGVKISIKADYAEFVAERNSQQGLWGMTTAFRKKTLFFIKKRLSPL